MAPSPFMARPWLVVFLLAFIALPVKAEQQSLQQVGTYNDTVDVRGWLMSEKLDGIRGYWTGKKMLTRSGHPMHPPPWFTQHLPPFPLDGELWSRREDFSFVQKTVLDATPSKNWRHITYNVFEVPGASGNFQARLKKVEQWLQAHPVHHLKIIPQIPCDGRKHLEHYLQQIEAVGGEGVIIKDPAIPFGSGENQMVFKVKSFQTMEGVVIAHNPGKGKFSEMLGSLSLQLADGTSFKLGSGLSTTERMTPPPLGSRVVFKHQGFTAHGIPRFASFLRTRQD